MLLVAAALWQEIASLCRALDRKVDGHADGASRVKLSQEASALFHALPLDARWQAAACKDPALGIWKLNGKTIAVLVHGVGKACAAGAISAACALLHSKDGPTEVLCVGCVLDLARGSKRVQDEHQHIPCALACIEAAIEHDVDCRAFASAAGLEFGRFPLRDTLVHARGAGLLQKLRRAAEACASTRSALCYRKAGMLSGDMYIDARSVAFGAAALPESVQEGILRLEKEHCEAVFLDMERAAAFSALSRFDGVAYAALAVVLDSVALSERVPFARRMKCISEVIAGVVFDIIASEK